MAQNDRHMKATNSVTLGGQFAPAARKAASNFDLFWNDSGSGMFVSACDDCEEPARKVAAATWAAAVEACARAAEGFTEERDDRRWVPGSLYDTLRRETAAAIRKLSNA